MRCRLGWSVCVALGSKYLSPSLSFFYLFCCLSMFFSLCCLSFNLTLFFVSLSSVLRCFSSFLSLRLSSHTFKHFVLSTEFLWAPHGLTNSGRKDMIVPQRNTLIKGSWERLKTVRIYDRISVFDMAGRHYLCFSGDFMEPVSLLQCSHWCLPWARSIQSIPPNHEPR
jgi:hypothetical protein